MYEGISTSIKSSKAVSTSNSHPSKKYIVVTGGVISGIGKGITASSIGVLIKMLNLRPTAIKIDPYLNVDAGTMSPYEHGETYVLDDGAETDLDLGNYERFLDVKLTNSSNLTTGKIYQTVINRERKGDYLGKTVQIIPHITNEIISCIKQVASQPVDDDHMEPDVCVIELGGTIGDIESMPFVEALRQLQLQVHPDNFCLVHVSMIPIIGHDNEQKTKPTQHSVKELRALGLAPDFIVCRAKYPILSSSREKISLFCNVPENHVLSIHDVSNIYEVPLLMAEQGFDALLSKRLGLDKVVLHHQQSSIGPGTFISKTISSSSSSYDKISYPWNPHFKSIWDDIVHKVESAKHPISIAIVGKYTVQSDAYASLISAIRHACISSHMILSLHMIESSSLDDRHHDASSSWQIMKSCDGVIIPGGFGHRGIEGMISACQYVREHKVPFLGICLGMQVAVIEYARHIIGDIHATSEEFHDMIIDKHQKHHIQHHDGDVIVFMPEGDRDKMGGTMRVGARTTILTPHSIASKLYDDAHEISERHRHRYEVNPKYVDRLEAHGMIFSGRDTTGERMEIVELDEAHHPYFVGVQFHPEYQSRPQHPAPVFHGFIQAIKQRMKLE